MYPVFFIVTKLTYMQHLVHVYTRFIIMLPRWNAYKPNTEVHSCIRIHTNT